MTLSSSFPTQGKKKGIFLLLLLVLVTVLSACGSTSPGTTSKAKYGGTLTVVASVAGNFTRNFDIFSPGSVLSGTQGLIYETLLYFNQQTGEVTPWLATSYQFSSDAKTLTFTTRQGVKWSDGQPFSSADVVFTLNYLHQHTAADTNALWNTLQSVTAPDDHTVVVALKQPSATVLWYLAGQTYILPQHLWQTVDNPVTFANPNPVGTGPFVVKSFTPQLYVLARNPHYWQPDKPYINEIHYPALTSNTSADLVLSQGSVDWMGVFTPNIQKTFVARDPAHNHYWFPPNGVLMMYLNLTKYPFNLLPVRQAFNLAIDRKQVSQEGEFGYETPANPTGLILPSFQSYLASQYAGVSSSVDTNKALVLLTSAGFSKGKDGIMVDQKGHRLSFTLNVVSGWTDWMTDCQIISRNLQAIGVDARVNPISFSDYFNSLQMGTFDTALSWTANGPTPYFLYNGLFNSNQSAPVGKAASQNWERWNSAQTDQLLSQYAQTTDMATQKQIVAQLQTIMVEQLPALPMLYSSTWYEYSTARFVGWPDASHPYATPAPFSAPDVEQVALHIHQ